MVMAIWNKLKVFWLDMTFKSAFIVHITISECYMGVKFSSLPDVKYSIYFKKSKDSKIQIGKGFTFLVEMV